MNAIHCLMPYRVLNHPIQVGNTLQPSTLALSPLLITLANEPLPDSNLFQLAAKSREELDESKLVHWNQDPPYLQPEPINTIAEKQFTKNLVDIITNRWIHLEKEAEAQHAQKYCAGEKQELVSDLCQTATEVFSQWMHLNELIMTCKAWRYKEMTESLFCWRARIIYSYLNKATLLSTDYSTGSDSTRVCK